MSATPTTSTPAAVPPQLRVVPGAPPPTALSKTQKKKRKAKVGGGDESEVATPVLEKVQLPAEDKEKSAVPEKTHEKVPAPESIAPADSTAAALDDDLIKLSPIVDLIHKRMKATTKKIVCFLLALLGLR